VQQKEITNTAKIADIPSYGRILALDPGTKKFGVAVSDETRTIATPVRTIVRHSWKKLLLEITGIIEEFDAKAVVIGLPYNTDGSESEMSAEARRIARNLSLSVDVPVFLQDERVTSYEAKGRLWERGVTLADTQKHVDSEAAAIILTDFLELLPPVDNSPS
jgi:putative Holliday junction resolvase